VAGDPPGVAAAPNPAREAMRFTLVRSAAGARLELLDLSGRRVWSAPPPPGGGTLTWRGERDGGGRVPPGVYFVRLEDARGVAVRRVTWLGGR